MSKIQEALKRLQSAGPPAKAAQARKNGFATENDGERSSIPVVRQKRPPTDLPKKRISQQALVDGGLLAPLDLAIPIADEFRQIKRPLIQNALRSDGDRSEHMNVIMIASAMPKSGKTFCSVNLAVSISLERELNVLLVDADVPKPHISREFGLEGEPALIDLIVDDTRDIEETLIQTDLNNIQVLPAGQRHPQATEMLASERMSAIVSELASRYPDRIIIIDSPPLLITSEAQALAGQVGQIALVVEAGQTSQQMLRQSIEVLDPSKAINLILNKSFHASRMGYYGGYYGYEGA